MRIKLFLVIAAMLVFGLAVVAYSYGTAGSASAAVTSCCCCSGDSCPMKTKKDASGKETTSCCDMDCCKGGADSCPMMKKDASGKMEHSECPMMKKDGSHADMKEGESCPMMKKDGAAATAATTDAKNDMSTMHTDMKGMHGDMKGMHGEGCCCPCCNKENKEQTKIDAPQG
jgi:hypothetical protein